MRRYGECGHPLRDREYNEAREGVYACAPYCLVCEMLNLTSQIVMDHWDANDLDPGLREIQRMRRLKSWSGRRADANAWCDEIDDRFYTQDLSRRADIEQRDRQMMAVPVAMSLPQKEKMEAWFDTPGFSQSSVVERGALPGPRYDPETGRPTKPYLNPARRTIGDAIANFAESLDRFSDAIERASIAAQSPLMGE